MVSTTWCYHTTYNLETQEKQSSRINLYTVNVHGFASTLQVLGLVLGPTYGPI